MQTPAKSSQIFSRIVLPFVLFLVVVGGVAWLIQYLPSFHRNAAESEFGSSEQNLIKFAFDKAAWPENGIKDYVPEYEPGQSDHYDFPLENISGREIEIGLEKSNCTCSDVRIALVPAGSTDPDTSKLIWDTLKELGKPGEKPAEADRVIIPVAGRGLVRLGWKAKDSGPRAAPATLSATLWMKPKGTARSPQFQKLLVAIRNVPPLQFFPEYVELAAFRGEVSDHIMCWSATRNLNGKAGSQVAIDTRGIDPGFEYKITPLTEAQRAAFQKELSAKGIPSQVKSAVRIDMNVYERKHDVSLDQGHLRSTVPLLLEGEKYVNAPPVSGYVLSDIRIHGSEDGRIRLGNINRDGLKKSFTILADPARTMLTLVAAPTNVDVKLAINREEGRNFWQLEIHVPPNTQHFPPAQNIIMLRSQPTPFYLAQIASAVASTAAQRASSQLGGFPDIAGFSNMITSWGIETRHMRIPVQGVVISSH